MVRLGVNQQALGKTNALKKLASEVRTRLCQCHCIDDKQAVLTHQLGKDCLYPTAVLLAIHFLSEITWAGGKSHAARAPQRAPNGPGPRIARAFLAPWLATTTGDIRAILLRFGSGAATRQIGSNHLVDQRLRKITAKHLVGDLDV